MADDKDRTSWIFGADPSCDVWINEPIVSTRHCELVKTRAGYELRDLDSSNGTFVNGATIRTANVNPTDDIRLANRVPMPWPDDRLAKQVVSIGAHRGNDVRLSHNSVSSYHARLLVDQNGQHIVKDLDSTNGTWIGEQRVDASVVSPRESFRLGAVVITSQQILSRIASADQSSTKPSPAARRPIPSAAIAGTFIILIMVGLLGIGSLLLVATLMASNKEAPSKPEPTIVIEASHETPKTVDTQPKEDQTTVDDGARLVVDEPSSDSAIEPDTEPAPQVKLSGIELVREAMFLLLVDVGGRQADFATAWAISPTRLVTNARVIGSLQDSGRVASVVHVLSGRQFEVVGTGQHPRFKESHEKMMRMLSETSRLKSESFTTKAAQRDAENAIRSNMHELPWVAREADSVDVGWVEIEPKDASINFLQIEPSTVGPGQKLKLIHGSILVASEYAEWKAGESRPLKSLRLQAIEPVVSRDPKQPERWETRFSSQSDDFQDYLYLGCPVVDLRGRIVGLYRGPKRALTAELGDYMSIQQRNPQLDMVSASMIRDVLPEAHSFSANAQ